MGEEHRHQSDLEFAAGCDLPLYPKFVEFAAAARQWLAVKMGVDASSLRSAQSLDLDADSLDSVELLLTANEELTFSFNEHDLILIQARSTTSENTVGAFIHRIVVDRRAAM
jgi:acyl carrier protein